MSEPAALSPEFAAATGLFERMLVRLRAVEHFAMGRRVLALVALAHFAPLSRYLLRGIGESGYDPAAMQSIVHAISEAAREVDGTHPHLAGVFHQTLIPDVMQSRWEETATYAGRLVRVLPPAASDSHFGAWFSDRLDQIVTSGPMASEVGTPPHLAEFMVFLAGVKDGQSVHDPCCGLGGLLTQAARAAGALNLDGAEVHPVSAAIAKLRLYLLQTKATIRRQDALREPASGVFDRVLCDPPLGVYAPAGEELGANQRGGLRRLDGLFLERSLESLAPAGRAVVVVSQGVLSRRGGPDQELRERLLDDGVLEAIISLPPGAVSWTNVELAIIVLSRQQRRNSARVLDGGSRAGRTLRPPVVLAALRSAYDQCDGEACREIGYAELRTADSFLPKRLLAPRAERPDASILRAEAEQLLATAAKRRPRIEDLFAQILGSEDPEV